MSLVREERKKEKVCVCVLACECEALVGLAGWLGCLAGRLVGVVIWKSFFLLESELRPFTP